jgi:anti-sigma regulatory factor (Ser/Thr protein kinase)
MKRTPNQSAVARQEPVLRLAFSRESLPAVRAATAEAAERDGLSRADREDLVLAVDELATNSVLHGGGSGELSLWSDEKRVLCEVRDRGHVADPLVGRRPPAGPAQLGGRGLWVVAQLCESVEICSAPGRTVVRARLPRR